MPTHFFYIHDIVNPITGKTYKEDNLEKNHNIPIGTLVELKSDSWFGNGACWKFHARMWVVKHYRDCDGTPLYSVSRWRDPTFALPFRSHNGFTEERLKIVELTEEIITGRDNLHWDEEEIYPSPTASPPA